jgi:hypothetical protein
LRYISEPFAQTTNHPQSSKNCESERLLYRNGLDVKREWGGYDIRPVVCSVGLIDRNHSYGGADRCNDSQNKNLLCLAHQKPQWLFD